MTMTNDIKDAIRTLERNCNSSFEDMIKTAQGLVLGLPHDRTYGEHIDVVLHALRLAEANTINQRRALDTLKLREKLATSSGA